MELIRIKEITIKTIFDTYHLRWDSFWSNGWRKTTRFYRHVDVGKSTTTTYLAVAPEHRNFIKNMIIEMVLFHFVFLLWFKREFHQTNKDWFLLETIGRWSYSFWLQHSKKEFTCPLSEEECKFFRIKTFEKWNFWVLITTFKRNLLFTWLLRLREGMQIFVKTLTGKTITPWILFFMEQIQKKTFRPSLFSI